MENRIPDDGRMEALLSRLAEALESFRDAEPREGTAVDLYLNGRLVSRALEEDAARAQSRLDRRIAMGVGQ